MGAIGNTLIFEQGCFWGMESVKITSVSFDFSIFSYALPERTAWVATARTLAAPLSISISAALQIVPAVSIMSSTTMIFLPSTQMMLLILFQERNGDNKPVMNFVN